MANQFNAFSLGNESAEDVLDHPTPDTKKPAPVSSQLTLPGVFESMNASEHEEKRSYERQMKHQIKRIVEALLFASSSPLSFNRIKEIVDEFYPVKPKQLRDLIEDLKEEYLSQARAFRLYEIAEGFILRSCEEYSRFIEKLGYSKRQEKLSQPSLEVLAIIAFRGPITRPEIDKIRGVDSSGVLQNLLERELIENIGKLEAPGKPSLYKITAQFLNHFGLKDISQLKQTDTFINSSQGEGERAKARSKRSGLHESLAAGSTPDQNMNMT